MSLLKPLPPPACTAAFSAQLATFLSGPSGLASQDSVGGPAQIPSATDIATSTADAQEVFLLSLKDAAFNPGVVSPTPAGWRFFAGGIPPAQMVLGRVIQRPASPNWKLVAVFYGPLVGDEWDAYQTVNNLPPILTANYSLRALEVPGLNFKAFWLTGAKRSDDLIVPYPVGPGQLISGLKGAAWYTMADFLTAVRPLATSNLTATGKYGA